MDRACRTRLRGSGSKKSLIQAVNTTLSQQVIHSRFYQDCDAVGFSSVGEVAVVLILHTQDGVIQGQVKLSCSSSWGHRGIGFSSIVGALC